MNVVEAKLKGWEQGLSSDLDVAALYARNPTTHKWKAPFRSLLLRKSVSWRSHDLLSQSLYLYQAKHMLGAQILLRANIETLAVLIYLNQLTRSVLSGETNFHRFSKKTSQLVLGSKDESTELNAINILTILKKCNDRYPKLFEYYESLSEAAHPNYEGMTLGYSQQNPDDEFVSDFSNRWWEIYSKNHLKRLETCIDIFLYEHDDEWVDAFEQLENWIEKNDDELERTKNDD